MIFTSLQTRVVNSVTPVVIQAPQYFWGFTATQRKETSGVTLVVSDSSRSAVTGTDIKLWANIHSATTRAGGGFVNGLFPYPLRITAGLPGRDDAARVSLPVRDELDRGNQRPGQIGF